MSVTDERILGVTLPQHCTFLVGLPTTREGFNASRSLDGRGYATNFLGGWRQYQMQFLDNLFMLARLAERLDVQFITDADCAALRAAFDNADRPIVILMSHTSQNAFEMNGQFIDVEQMLNTVPAGFPGVFDIFACEPNELAEQLVLARRDCLIRFLPRHVHPTLWIVYFQSLFRLLHMAHDSYLSASEAITISLTHIGRATMKPTTPNMTPTKPIRDALSSFVVAIKQDSDRPLADQQLSVDPHHTDTLLGRFERIKKSNKISKLLAIAVLVTTFLATLYFAFLYRYDIKSLAIILGGNFLSLLVIAGWLRRIWLEGTTLDILCILVQDLPPKEAVQVITTFYSATLASKV